MKYRLIIAMLLILSVIMSGCTKEEIADKRGNMLKYESKEVKTGYYISNDDYTFTPLMGGVSGYQGEVTESVPGRFLWYTHNSYDLTSLIPVLSSNSRLVIIYDADEDMPQSYIMERYKPVGTTLGARFKLGDNSKLFLLTDIESLCPDSQLGEGVKSMDLPQEVQICEFNGSSKLPVKNIDEDTGMIMGLEEGKTYQIGFYTGTRYHSKEATADTHLMKAEEVYTLKAPFDRTKDGFFIIKMPKEAPSGYYYIADEGLFYYKK